MTSFLAYPRVFKNASLTSISASSSKEEMAIGDGLPWKALANFSSEAQSSEMFLLIPSSTS